MGKRYDALYARDYNLNGEARKDFMRIGVAFESQRGGVDLILYAVPAANAQGEYRIMLREPDPEKLRQRQERRSAGEYAQGQRHGAGGGQQAPQSAYNRPGPQNADGDDNIPF